MTTQPAWLKAVITIVFSAFLWALVASVAVAEEPRKIKWSDLIPEGYEPEKLLQAYEDDINRLNDLPDNSPEGLAILEKLQDVIANSPVNEKLDGQTIALAGFIAPLAIKNGTVTRFLFVPYFGACIHVPAPPVNQTILVDTAPGQGIKLHQVDFPFLVTGKLTLQHTQTDIGSAGYHLIDAHTEQYKDEVWLE
ncbi:MAG: DUF3299 domain-containing protein [Hydrogenovibrio sp.]